MVGKKQGDHGNLGRRAPQLPFLLASALRLGSLPYTLSVFILSSSHWDIDSAKQVFYSVWFAAVSPAPHTQLSPWKTLSKQLLK